MVFHAFHDLGPDALQLDGSTFDKNVYPELYEHLQSDTLPFWSQDGPKAFIWARPWVGDTFEEKVVTALEKIAEGVYHEEDVGEKKPLAKTIALLLAGLNINYAGD